jgi:hypothetical protein
MQVLADYPRDWIATFVFGKPWFHSSVDTCTEAIPTVEYRIFMSHYRFKQSMGADIFDEFRQIHLTHERKQVRYRMKFHHCTQSASLTSPLVITSISQMRDA